MRKKYPQLDPAAAIINRLGGLTAVATGINTTVTTVQRWRMPRKRGGTGGFIPRDHHAAIIKMAREAGFDLPVSAFLDVSALPQQEVAA